MKAMGVWWGKNNTYPEEPTGQEILEPPEGKGTPMTDGARFAAFAAAHRRAIAKERQKTQG